MESVPEVFTEKIVIKIPKKEEPHVVPIPKEEIPKHQQEEKPDKIEKPSSETPPSKSTSWLWVLGAAVVAMLSMGPAPTKPAWNNQPFNRAAWK